MNTCAHRRPDLFHAAAFLLLAATLGSGCASAGRLPAGRQGRAGPEAPPAARSASGDASPPSASLEKTATPPVEPTVVSEPHYRDPLIHVNRGIFAFNDVAYRYMLIPLSKGYIWLIPERARRSVGNFFHNLRTPIYVVNDLLQLKPKSFGRHLSRFLINSTVGLGGLFDPAQAKFGLEKSDTGFEDTLARYGAGYGIYLVLPIFGSSDLRNGVGRAADYFLNPVPYLTDDPATTAVMTYDGFQVFAPGAEKYETLRREVKDRYIFFRNLYLQGVQRDAEHH